MSEVRPDIDLSALARAPSSIPRPRRSPWRILLPALILLVFSGVLATSLRGVLGSRKTVTLVRPRPALAAVGETGLQSPQRVLLQAAGWIEPDPFPIEVTALTSGVLREVLALESERVSAGQVMARLVDDDARLALAAGEAAVLEARADCAAAEAQVAAATIRFERALEVTEKNASATAQFEARQAQLLQSEAAARQAESSLRVERDELSLQKELESAGSVGERVVELAQARVDVAQAALEMQRAAIAVARAERDAAGALQTRARLELELRVDDTLALSSANAQLQRARAILAKAEVGRDEAKLRLRRTEVVAPADGIVLERRSVPGSEIGAGRDALVYTLFDPTHLRVRVDVPQGDIAKLQVGARAEISTDSRAGKPYNGRIVRFVQKADIQKVTLQVHVRVEDGDEWLRPEMLAQVRFFSGTGQSDAGSGATPAADRVEIPKRVVEDEKFVWTVDGIEGTALRVQLELGAVRGEWVEVLSGLDLSAKVIDEGRAQLKPGDRVRSQERQP